ncbi:MAG: methylglyoxal synthase [Bacteroidota bacterium]
MIVALVAHDNRKPDLIDWVEYNWEKLIVHNLVCTGTTGRLIEESLKEKRKGNKAPKPHVLKLKSGPLGGDQQLGAMIAEEKIDMFIFFWDTMNPQPHDVDVKALLRIATLYNIPTAQNRATADFLISSPLFGSEYQPQEADFSTYLSRELPET